MIEQVAAAFERGDYKTAAKLLKPLFQTTPDNPWVQLYVGRLQEVHGKLDGAERTYRQLLQATTNAKVAMQARQGLQRLAAPTQTAQGQAVQKQPTAPVAVRSHRATSATPNRSIGFLVLEPVTGAARSPVVQSFARIMKLDPYTAQLQLPSRSWRLYRTGTVTELAECGQELLQANIPAFWVALSEIEKIRVFRVRYLQAGSPEVTVVCENEDSQLGSLTFAWSEVARRVQGLLPIFEDVVDRNLRMQLQRKEQTSDYAQICDLHLPGRKCILRLCDSTYDFQQGLEFREAIDATASIPQTTTRINWNNLLNHVNQHLKAVPAWSGFTAFAETALEHLERAGDFPSHIDLFRKAESNWDCAFQLYSGLVFLKP
jgi:tetratricopeptide (TPR) repeat protein